MVGVVKKVDVAAKFLRAYYQAPPPCKFLDMPVDAFSR